MRLVQFMTSPKGRMARIVMGSLLIALGLLIVKDTVGIVIALIGLIPISGGILDFCLAGYMLGYPFSGAKAREQLRRQ